MQDGMATHGERNAQIAYKFPPVLTFTRKNDKMGADSGEHRRRQAVSARQPGNLVIAGLVLLNPILWLIFLLPDTPWSSYTAQFVGEMLSSTAIILIAITICLSARFRFLERYFGGLDRMYQTHRRTAILASLLIALHFSFIPDSGVPVVGKPLGVVAILGIISLVLLTLAPRLPLISRVLRLPYHRWRILHRLLGAFFIVGLAHFFNVYTIAERTIPALYMLAFAAVGVLAYLYKQLIAGRVRRHHDYVVEAVRRLNDRCVEVTLKPLGQKLSFEAGQFLFVGFTPEKHGDIASGHQLAEPHPFTISSSPKEDTLRLSIRESGDWTRRLAGHLQAGATAKVEGAYGMFNYKRGGDEQIWIAGGIGVTPFLSWVRDFDGQPGADVDFFYTVHSQADALFWDEFQAASQMHPTFRAHLHRSSEDGHLSAERVVEMSRGQMAGKHIYMCGPVGVVHGFASRFRQLGVSAANIHYEEFNFR
jgi:predicted ferric reductase